jgi:hypothetical protein
MNRVLSFPGCEGLPLNPSRRRRALTPGPEVMALAIGLSKIRHQRPFTFQVLERMVYRTNKRIADENNSGGAR